jgi:hypothetical protein
MNTSKTNPKKRVTLPHKTAVARFYVYLLWLAEQLGGSMLYILDYESALEDVAQRHRILLGGAIIGFAVSLSVTLLLVAFVGVEKKISAIVFTVLFNFIFTLFMSGPAYRRNHPEK